MITQIKECWFYFTLQSSSLPCLLEISLYTAEQLSQLHCNSIMVTGWMMFRGNNDLFLVCYE